MRLRIIGLSFSFVVVFFVLQGISEVTSSPSPCIVNAPSSDRISMPPQPRVFLLQRELTFRSYSVRVYIVAETRIAEDAQSIGLLEIWKDGQLVCQQKGWRYFAPPDNLEIDSESKKQIAVGNSISGDGIPNLVIMEWSGGAHCCYSYYVFQFGDEFHYLATINAWDGGVEFKNLDGDSDLEIIAHDWTFRYWHTCFACSPAPVVILRFEQGAYHLAFDLMQQHKTVQEVAAHAQEVQSDPYWKGGTPPEKLWAYMLDLIYTGQADLAWQFFDSAWSSNVSGKAKFLAEFTARLTSSQYWPELEKMNKFDE